MPPEAEQRLTHPILHVPVVVDGLPLEPWEISQFDGQQLHFVLDEFALKAGEIYAFTTLEGLRTYLEHSEKLSAQIKDLHATPDSLVVPCEETPEDPSCDGGGGTGGGGTGGGGTTGDCSCSGSPTDCTNRCWVVGDRSIAYFYKHHCFDGDWMSLLENQSLSLCNSNSAYHKELSSVEAAGSWTILYDGCFWSVDDLWIAGNLNCETLHSNFGWGDKAESLRVVE